ncbi:hypothetical protein CHUAL_012812 [Chamberlinius hualienensis]
MWELLSTFASSLRLLSAKSRSGFFIDDVIFRLHYRYTAKTLYMSGLFSALVLLFNDWIQCLTHEDLLPQNLMNVYCWMQNTFILPSKLTGIVGDDIISPGIDRETSTNERVYVTYYQWWPFFLFFQGFCFEIGHIIWKQVESSETANMSSGFQLPIAREIETSNPMSDDERERGLNLIAEYINKKWSSQSWSSRPWKYLLCIFINSANVLLQVYLLMFFVKINHISDSWEVYRNFGTHYAERNDTMITVFPRVTKCIFHQFGAGGSVQTHDIMCMLPFNVYSEIFFSAAMVWFYLLTAVSILHFLLWFFVLVSSPLRKTLSCAPVIHMFPRNKHMIDWHRNLDIKLKNWFMMWLLCKNIHPNHIEALLAKLDFTRNYNTNIRRNEKNVNDKLTDSSET